MLKYLLLLFTGIFICLSSYAQDVADVTLYENMDAALSDPVNVKHLNVNYSEENISKLAKNAGLFVNLESLTITGKANGKKLDELLNDLSGLKKLNSIKFVSNELTEAPASLGKLQGLKKISVYGNSSLDYKGFLKTIASLPQLKILEFENNGLDKLPKEIELLNDLKSLKISGNENLDYEKVFESLSHLPKLTELSIPINQITDLPKNIVKLTNLEVLDVSSNVITSIPAGIASIKKLNSLSINGNMVVNQAEELQKFKGLDIKYLAIDKDPDEKQLAQIKKLFPNAKIEFPTSAAEKFLDLADSTQTSGYLEMEKEPKAEAAPKAPAEVLPADEIETPMDFKVLSAAYLSYPVLFKDVQFRFDTMPFDQRYKDTTYANIWRVQPNKTYTTISLTMNKRRKGASNETWFHLPNTQDATRNNPELLAFSGMYWVYTGDLPKKKFYKTFLTAKYFSDIRIRYNEPQKNFTIELKNEHGFISFDAYPRINPDVSLDITQKSYTKKFNEYIQTLNKRAEAFNRLVKRDKDIYNRTFTIENDKAWNQLRTMMSDRERNMSRKQWLRYYDKIVADERVALDKAQAVAKNFCRSLETSKYRQVKVNKKNNAEHINVEADFKTPDGKGLAVATIYVIERDGKTYHSYAGSLGVEPNKFVLNPASATAIVIETRNGDLSVIKQDELKATKFSEEKHYTLKVMLFDKNKTTIGEVRKAIGLLEL